MLPVIFCCSTREQREQGQYRSATQSVLILVRPLPSKSHWLLSSSAQMACTTALNSATFLGTSAQGLCLPVQLGMGTGTAPRGSPGTAAALKADSVVLELVCDDVLPLELELELESDERSSFSRSRKKEENEVTGHTHLGRYILSTLLVYFSIKGNTTYNQFSEQKGSV